MKAKMILIATTASLFLVCILSITACSNVRQLDAAEFIEEVKEIHEIHSIKTTRLIGVCGERVYLEHWHAPLFFGSGITVYWTPISDLPENIALDLNAGKNPWKK